MSLEERVRSLEIESRMTDGDRERRLKTQKRDRCIEHMQGLNWDLPKLTTKLFDFSLPRYKRDRGETNPVTPILETILNYSAKDRRILLLHFDAEIPTAFGPKSSTVRGLMTLLAMKTYKVGWFEAEKMIVELKEFLDRENEINLYGEEHLERINR